MYRLVQKKKICSSFKRIRNSEIELNYGYGELWQKRKQTNQKGEKSRIKLSTEENNPKYNMIYKIIISKIMLFESEFGEKDKFCVTDIIEIRSLESAKG